MSSAVEKLLEYITMYDDDDGMYNGPSDLAKLTEMRQHLRGLPDVCRFAVSFPAKEVPFMGAFCEVSRKFVMAHDGPEDVVMREQWDSPYVTDALSKLDVIVAKMNFETPNIKPLF
jgi:hypothetical protein